MVSEQQATVRASLGETESVDEPVSRNAPYWCSECELEAVVLRRVCEHTRCGHVDFEVEFEGDDGRFCPHCNESGESESIKDVSAVFRCDACGRVFDTPPESRP